MSKVDAMRALREARYAATTKAGGAGVKAPAAPKAAAPTPSAPKRAAAPASAAAEATDALCGHRNMGGKSCTRELDHVRNGTKNHRYG